MKFYRYNAVNYAVHDADGEYVSPSYPNPQLRLEEFVLHKETPKGWWIGYGGALSEIKSFGHWVSKTSRKKYAYLTKEEALNSFIKRKERQVRILTYQLSNAKLSLQIAKDTKIV